uniref:Uncharacterized protein n=1 Tax=Arion vulgaris TaxID=1028688 RepID=A0A0B6XZE3_9EUPU
MVCRTGTFTFQPMCDVVRKLSFGNLAGLKFVSLKDIQRHIVDCSRGFSLV